MEKGVRTPPLQQWNPTVRDWTQLQIQHGQMEMYNQEAGCKSMGEKVLRGNISGRGILAKPT